MNETDVSAVCVATSSASFEKKEATLRTLLNADFNFISWCN